MEKNELEVALKMSRNSLTEKVLSDTSLTNKHPTSSNEVYKLFRTLDCSLFFSLPCPFSFPFEHPHS